MAYERSSNTSNRSGSGAHPTHGRKDEQKEEERMSFINPERKDVEEAKNDE